MKIYYDNIIFNLQKAGGISIYWYEIIRRLLKNQKNVTYIEQKNKITNLFRKKIVLNNIIQDIFLPLKLLRYLPLLKKIPANSIFHSSYYRVSLQKNVINITTLHDFTYEYYAHGIAKLVHFYQKKFALYHSDGIICISENTKKDLFKFHPWAKNKIVKVIHNGVSEDFFCLEKDQNNDFYQTYKNMKYILYVGDRAQYKNFNLLVEALSTLQKYTLIIVGSKKLNHKELKILNANLDNRYIHLKDLNNEHLNIIYNLAFCLVYPSRYEGFGIPPLEAMKAGCPVITTNSSSIPEVVGEAAIQIENINDKKIKDAILKLEALSFRKEIIAKGLNQANQFSWEKTYQAIFEFYNFVKNSC